MRPFVYTTAGIIALSVFVMHFFYAHDPYGITGLLMAAALTACLYKQAPKFTWIDLGVLLWWVYMVVSPTVNPWLSWQSVKEYTDSCLFYFLLRCLFSGPPKYSSRMMAAFTVCIFIFSVLAGAMFTVFQSRLHELGFSSLYDFRFLYAPLGVPNNEWNSLQWLFGGILAGTYIGAAGKHIRRLAMITGGIVLWLAFVSFSRGMYVSGAIFAVLLLVTMHKRLFRPAHIAPLVIYTVIIVGVFYLYPQETGQVMRMNATASQQRSTEGRLHALQLTTDILHDYPWGVGAGNYTLAKDYYLTGDKRPGSYTSYAPNTPTKICVENGYAGMALYLFLLVAGLVWLIRKKDYRAWLIALFLIGYFVRELTFSTLLESSRAQLSAMLLIALLQKEEHRPVAGSRMVWALPCLAWVIAEVLPAFTGSPVSQIQANNPLDVRQQFLQAVHEKDEARMRQWADKYPDKVTFRWALYLLYKEQGQPDKAAGALSQCILQEPRILGTDFWSALEETSPTLARQVKDSLTNRIQMKESDPIKLAKYGSIALQTGHQDTAARLLHQTNQMLSGLSRVWFNLSCIWEQKGDTAQAALCKQRGQIMETGIFANDTSYTPQTERDITLLLTRHETMLQRDWYGIE